MFRRRHHCRLCGQIFCSKCCNQIVPGKIINCSGDLRVCTYCSKVVLSYLKSSDITADLKSDLQALEDDLSNKFVGTSSNASSNNLYIDPNNRRKVSVGYQEERLVTNPNILSNADRKNILQQSNSLKALYEDMINSLSIQNKGIDLINFLIFNQKASTKPQAMAVLNALIEAGFMVPLTNYENTDKDASTSEIDSFHVDFNENSFYKLKKIDEIPVDGSLFGSFKRGTSLSEDTSIEDFIPPSIQDNMYTTNKDHELENSILSTAGSKPLLEAYCNHEELLLSQLLRNKNLDNSWSKVLIPLCARIAHTIHPEFCGKLDSMDIRNFVNIKKISAGTRNECSIIGGVVFTKNVAHKDMATKIDNPKILLLQCAIAYQRIEGKFVTIESLLLQEKEYLRNVTSRILSLKPNVVLVHKNVAGIAQDMLRQNGVTLILDVKLSVFERLERCLECDVVTSIDSNIGKPKLGKCNKFYTKNFMDNSGAIKTLMFFEIPYSQRGCSLLLRGCSESELSKVKKVASFLLFSRYNFRLELAFLLDLFASPPSPKPSIFDSIDQSPLGDVLKQLENILDIPKADDKACANILLKKDKSVNIENVADFSDPLRATNLSPTLYEPESIVEFEVQRPFDNKFRTSLNSTILSISPCISLPLPFLESEAGKKCILREFFPQQLYYSKQWMNENEKPIVTEPLASVQVSDEPQNVKPPHEFLTMNITASIDSKDIQTAIADFRRAGGRYPKVTTMKKIERKVVDPHQLVQKSMNDIKDALDILNHQRLPVLFCSYYYNNTAKELSTSFCTQPLCLDMHFYGQNDIMLGLFLKRYCFSYICSSCELPMMGHFRRYAHSLGCIQVKLDQDPNKGDGTSIIIASRCTICNATTPNVTMSSDTWCMSFAKFLELKFLGHSYKRRVIDNLDPQLNQEHVCCHSLQKDHIQYFSSNGVIASFHYSPIEIWEIKLPKLVVELKKPELIDNKVYGEKIKGFSVKGYEIYAKIHEKLANLSSDVELPMLASLKKVLHRDQLIFKHRVEVVYHLLTGKEVYSNEINDAMLLVHKELADSIELWGPRLNQAIIHTKNSQKLEPSHSIDHAGICCDVMDDQGSNNLESDPYNDMELDMDQNSMSKSIDDLQSMDHKNIKEKIDKKTIRKLLSTLLPSTNSDQNPLPSPFTLHEHFCLSTGQFPILVHDLDLSSIIAYSLMSFEYKKALENLYLSGSQVGSSEISGSNSSPMMKRKNLSESSVEVTTDEKDGSNNKDSSDKNKKQTLNSHHVETIFQDSNTHFTCKNYFAKEFDELRSKCLLQQKTKGHLSSDGGGIDNGVEEIRRSYARSLSESIRWEARGGKSGSQFSKTSDDRFILKEMSKQDIGEFEKFAPHYFEYVDQCLQNNHPTLLAKIFGVYKVIIKKKE